MAESSLITEDRQKSQITIKLPNASPGTPETTSTRDKIIQKDDNRSEPTTRRAANDLSKVLDTFQFMEFMVLFCSMGDKETILNLLNLSNLKLNFGLKRSNIKNVRVGFKSDAGTYKIFLRPD